MSFLSNMFKPSVDEQQKRSEEVIEALRQRRGMDTGKWLVAHQGDDMINKVMQGAPLPVLHPPKLEDIDKYAVDDTQTYVAPLEATYIPVDPDAVQAPRKVPTGNAQTEWIEAMFEEFARNAKEFNQIANDQNLLVSVVRPAYSAEPSLYDTYTPGAKMSVFKGHISTRGWALMIQGHATAIEIFAVRSDTVLRYTLSDIHSSGLKPFTVIASDFVNGALQWRLDDQILSKQMLAPLAKELFGDLIRIATGKMNESELFAEYETGWKLGETVALGYEANTASPKANSDAASSPSPTATASIAPGVVSGDVDLETWDKCRTLLQTLNTDLGKVAGKEYIAKDSGDEASLKKLKDLSNDLRALSGGLSELLSKYAPK